MACDAIQSVHSALAAVGAGAVRGPGSELGMLFAVAAGQPQQVAGDIHRVLFLQRHLGHPAVGTSLQGIADKFRQGSEDVLCLQVGQRNTGRGARRPGRRSLGRNEIRARLVAGDASAAVEQVAPALRVHVPDDPRAHRALRLQGAEEMHHVSGVRGAARDAVGHGGAGLHGGRILKKRFQPLGPRAGGDGGQVRPAARR